MVRLHCFPHGLFWRNQERAEWSSKGIRILKFQKYDHRIRPCGVSFAIATIVKT